MAQIFKTRAGKDITIYLIIAKTPKNVVTSEVGHLLIIVFITDINECSSNPCLNGGSCTDHRLMAMLVAVSQDTQEDSVKQVRNILSVVISPEWFSQKL